MADGTVYFGGQFTKSEKMTQYLKNYMLFLYIRGFDYLRVYPHLLQHPAEDFPERMDRPLLALFPPGTILDFSAGCERENWAIVFNRTDLSASENCLNCTINQTLLQSFIWLDMDQAMKIRSLFAEVSRHAAAGHPAAAEKAKLLLGSLLSELIADSMAEKTVDPAAAMLKNAIDKDVHFKENIGEICARLHIGSLPYMRKLFLQEYGILPHEYRQRQRMNRILELFSQTDFTLKMIADEVGMKHLPHLYTFLKERQELTPKELLLQFRGRKN